MQKELIALQPELVKTSEETEKLMDVIEHETIEVEAKKEVSPVTSHKTAAIFNHVFIIFIVAGGCGRRKGSERRGGGCAVDQGRV